jgi:hypothetical protein
MGLLISPSRIEWELPLDGVVEKAMGKGFGIKTCQIVVGTQEMIQNPPQQRCQNVITQIVSWEKPDPNYKSVKTMENIPTATLDRNSPHFSDDKSPQGGNLGDPRGIETKSDRMANESPIGQVWR